LPFIVVKRIYVLDPLLESEYERQQLNWVWADEIYDLMTNTVGRAYGDIVQSAIDE